MKFDLIGMELDSAKHLLDNAGQAYSIIELSTFKLENPDCICVVKVVDSSDGLILYTGKFKKQLGENI